MTFDQDNPCRSQNCSSPFWIAVLLILVINSFAWCQLAQAEAVPLDSVAEARTPSVAGAVPPPQSANVLTTDILEPVDGLDKVDSNIFRGPLPDRHSLESAKKAGVTTIVSLCNEKKAVAREAKDASALGLKFINIPLSALRRPSDADIRQFLDIVHRKDQDPVYVHCLHGRDRTGVMIGLYRVVENGWNGDDAYREMLRKGFRPFFTNLASPLFAYARAQGHPARSRGADFFGGLIDRYGRRRRT